MLNVATPILQIKSKGIDLSNIRSMTIIIQSLNVTITKNNDDIEVDGNLILVFLTQLEASSLNSGEFNISILAIDINGNNVSDKIKMIWAKRSSISSTKNSNAPSNGNLIWYPMVSDEGIISWQKSDSDVPPESKNIKGENGFSPTITENPENSDTVYKLDIVTADSRFTTPNLIGLQNNDLPFQIDKWYVISASEYLNRDGSTWNMEIPDINVVYTLSLAIEATQDITVYGSAIFNSYALVKLYFNEKNTFNKTNISTWNGGFNYELKKGVNTLKIDFYKLYGYEATISMTIPDAIQISL